MSPLNPTRRLPTDRPPRSMIRARLARLAASAIVASSVLIVAAPPAGAYGTALSCTGRAETQAFKVFGDMASYFRASNGGFESGSTDWQLSGGASIVAGNETWKVGAPTDAKSAALPVGAKLVSRTHCISRGEDRIRFFVKSSSTSNNALLKLDLTITANGNTSTVSYDFRGNAIKSGWNVTPVILISDLFGGTGTENVEIKLTNLGSTGTWYVDDVYFDPFKSY